MREYNKLFQDVVKGLINQGYVDVGGNDDSFLIMRNPQGKVLKLFLRDYDHTSMEDMNYLIIRFC